MHVQKKAEADNVLNSLWVHLVDATSCPCLSPPQEAPMSFMWGVKVTEGGGSEVEDDTATVKPKRVALLFPAKTFELLVSTLEEALERL